MTLSFKDLKQTIAKTNSIVPENITRLPYKKLKATFIPMNNKQLKSFLKSIEKKDEYLINAALDEILQSCVLTVENEPFDVDTLCLADRTHLLLQIRKASSGNIVTFPHINEVLDEPVVCEVDIDSLEVKYQLEDVKKDVYFSGDTVKIELGLVTRKDEKELESYLMKHGGKNSVVDRRFCSYACMIKSVHIKNEETGEYEEVDMVYKYKVDFVTDILTPKFIDDEVNTFANDYMDFGVDMTFNFEHGDYQNEKEEISIISFFIT